MSVPVEIKRLVILPAVAVLQACLGGVYAWSAFVPILTETHGWTMGRAQLVFGFAILTFTCVMVAAGHLLARWGTRGVALIGALLFSIGHMVCACSGGGFSGMLVGYGLLGGAGIGFGYVAALSSGLQWFPRRKGAATGVAVAGFGLGGWILASVAEKWIREQWTVPEMFGGIGVIYGAVLVVCALLFFRPPGAVANPTPDLSAGWRFFASKGFRILAVGMFSGTFAGLLVIGLLNPMGLDGGLSPETTTHAIGGLAFGNVAGRLIWGWLYDHAGYRTIPISLALLGLALVGLMAARMAPGAFLVVSSLVGFGFGACFVLYAAHVAARYGTDHVGRLYPFLFLSYGVAGVAGPFLGGLLRDWTGRYSTALFLGALMAAWGAWRTWRPPAMNP